MGGGGFGLVGGGGCAGGTFVLEVGAVGGGGRGGGVLTFDNLPGRSNEQIKTR